MNTLGEYEYEQELADGSCVYWTICYEVEPANDGGRDEPSYRGYASVCEIKHADGSALPEDSWASAGFDKAKLHELNATCYESWADAHGPDDDDSNWRGD